MQIDITEELLDGQLITWIINDSNDIGSWCAVDDDGRGGRRRRLIVRLENLVPFQSEQ